MRNGLYHSSIHIPAQILEALPTGAIKLNYSFHAIQSSKNDRYGNFSLPTSIEISNKDIVEVEVFNNKPVKMVVRKSFTSSHDLVLVVLPESGFVKTTWLNSRFDNHRTLDRSKYVCGK